LNGLDNLVFVKRQKPRPAVPTLHEAEAARITSDVDVDQQLFSNTERGISLQDVCLPDDTDPDAHYGLVREE
jgi:hypothetical protein